LPDAIDRGVADFVALLAANGSVRTRREAEEWSPLEYACHVRDVLFMQRDRLFVALVEEEPSFKPMYREERVALDRYNDQSPTEVSQQLTMAAAMFANLLRTLDQEQWTRSLVYGFPDPARRDVTWVGHHTLHEVVHHRQDITGNVQSIE
jgi:S-DNA-T family DNA segregation ATPase FtsK/SpoIIIE